MIWKMKETTNYPEMMVYRLYFWKEILKRELLNYYWVEWWRKKTLRSSQIWTWVLWIPVRYSYQWATEALALEQRIGERMCLWIYPLIQLASYQWAWVRGYWSNVKAPVAHRRVRASDRNSAKLGKSKFKMTMLQIEANRNKNVK